MPDAPRSSSRPEQAAGTPRWVKVSGLLVLLALVVAAVLLTGGEHGPGRHLSSAGAPPSGAAPSAVAPAGGGGR